MIRGILFTALDELFKTPDIHGEKFAGCFHLDAFGSDQLPTVLCIELRCRCVIDRAGEPGGVVAISLDARLGVGKQGGCDSGAARLGGEIKLV